MSFTLEQKKSNLKMNVIFNVTVIIFTQLQPSVIIMCTTCKVLILLCIYDSEKYTNN